MPFMPLTTETVYTRQVTARIAMVMRRVSLNPKSSETILAHQRGRQRKSRGCAGQQCEDRHQINQGSGKSVCVFSEDRAQASEYFCLWQPRT